MRRDTVADLVARHLPPKAYAEQWDIEGLAERVENIFGLQLPLAEWAAEEGIANEEMEERINAAADARAEERMGQVGVEQMRDVEKNFLLQMIDMQWREHLVHLDHLRQVIGLRGYGQRDPLNEYKTEAFSLFEKLLGDLRQNVTRWLMTVEFRFEEPEAADPACTCPTSTRPTSRRYTSPRDRRERDGRPGRPAPEAQLAPEKRARLPVELLPEGWERTSRNATAPAARAASSSTATARWSRRLSGSGWGAPLWLAPAAGPPMRHPPRG
jgi:preprotein translocase subunit SecA